MTNAEIARAIVEKGWEMRYRGGNAVCSTPSDLDVIVADAPATDGAPSSPETRPRYSIAAWPTTDPDGNPRPPVFDLYDAERDSGVRVDRIPAPEEARRLLERHETGNSSPENGGGA